MARREAFTSVMCAATILVLAACGSTPQPSPASESSPIAPAALTGLSGSVSWPDGTPVRNASLLDFYPYGLADSYTGTSITGPAGNNFQGQTDANGKYRIPNACNRTTCPALFGFLLVPWLASSTGHCSLALIPQGQNQINPSTPQVVSITPPAQLNYQVVNGYCLDLETEQLGAYNVAPPQLAGGHAPVTWLQVKQSLGTGTGEDACVVGRWSRLSEQQTAQLVLNGVATSFRISGGAGEILSISAGGMAIYDDSHAAPYTGTVNGGTAEYISRGTLTTLVHADSGNWNETPVSTDETYQWVIHGVAQPVVTPTLSQAFSPTPIYTCNRSLLSLFTAPGQLNATFQRS
jgi:hypothetical protein